MENDQLMIVMGRRVAMRSRRRASELKRQLVWCLRRSRLILLLRQHSERGCCLNLKRMLSKVTSRGEKIEVLFNLNMDKIVRMAKWESWGVRGPRRLWDMPLPMALTSKILTISITIKILFSSISIGSTMFNWIIQIKTSAKFGISQFRYAIREIH